MAADYKGYLAANVFNDGRVVTYRLLSRALKVHVNLAKQMLYDFHNKQNAKIPGSVHATYLLSGILRPVETSVVSTGRHVVHDGEDVVMQSSPFMSSAPQKEEDSLEGEKVRVTDILLVKQEDLQRTMRLYDTISSIHMYSIAAKCPQDLQIISDSNREIVSTYAHEDPLIFNAKYGTILNPQVKRRKRPQLGQIPTAPLVPIPKPSTTSRPPPTLKKEASSTSTNPESKSEPNNTTSSATASFLRGKPQPPKREHSDIFASFAKSKTKAAPAPKHEPQRKPSNDSKPVIIETGSTDEPMKEVCPRSESSSDNDEDDNEALKALTSRKTLPPDTTTQGGETRQSRLERERKLKDMMDLDDNPPTPDVQQDDEEQPPSGQQDTTTEVELPDTEPPSTDNGRRRGRRRVTRKQTVKDEEGYLVTREEQAWESFSEEEPQREEKRLKVGGSAGMSSASSSGKKGASQGQGQDKGQGQAKTKGNLMSFFKKR